MHFNPVILFTICFIIIIQFRVYYLNCSGKNNNCISGDAFVCLVEESFFNRHAFFQIFTLDRTTLPGLLCR